MSSTPSWRHPATPQRGINQSLTATASLRQLLESMSREQRSNQELLVSVGVAWGRLRNLNRGLELVLAGERVGRARRSGRRRRCGRRAVERAGAVAQHAVGVHALGDVPAQVLVE